MSGTFNKTARDLAQALKTISAQATSPYDTQAEVRRIEGKTAWVHIPGGVDETPVQLTMNAKKGDVVQVRVSGGQAWLYGNATSPPTDDTKAIKAEKRAMVADEHAVSAVTSAMLAQQAADEAIADAYDAATAANIANEKAIAATADAERAERKANEAEQSANQAYQSAFESSVAAETASGLATNAYNSAIAASDLANTAQSVANAATSAAAAASIAAADAQSDALIANGNALEAQRLAGLAQGAAVEAQDSATSARDRANEAYNSAVSANTAASGAIESLGIVQDIVGVLNWVSEHGDYVLTNDETVIPGKYYFVRSGTSPNYSYAVVTPSEGANPKTLGYYELTDASESVSNYISTHMALSNNGLYLQTDEGEGTSRMLVSPTEGVVLFGPDGSRVATYGSETIIGNLDSLHLEISNNKLSFCQGQEEVAYVSGQRLYISQSVVLNEMMLGNNKWAWRFDDRDDAIYLKWIG